MRKTGLDTRCRSIQAGFACQEVVYLEFEYVPASAAAYQGAYDYEGCW
jgi:hypothetical protein